MKKNIICGICIMFLLVNLVIGATDIPWEQMNENEKFKSNPQRAFEEFPSDNNFARPEVPKTAANFARLSDTGKVKHWNNLPIAEKGIYLQNKDFSNSVDKRLAHDFFSNSANINNNKGTFGKFAKSNGVAISLIGDVVSYSSNGLLRANNGDINIIEFKDQYSFEVDGNGNLIIVDKLSKKHTFQGSVKRGNNGKIELPTGEIDGKSIEEGSDIKLDGDIISGSTKKFGGVGFDKQTVFSYDKASNLLTLSNANVVSIDENIGIRGTNVKLPGNNRLIQGALLLEGGRITKVMENTNAVIEGFNHITKSSELNLYYNEEYNSGKHKGNFFIYNFNKKSVALGGRDYESILTQDNEIFQKALSRFHEGEANPNDLFSLSPNDGFMNIQKVSQDGSPLQLDVDLKGKSIVRNGLWILESDGNNLYVRATQNKADSYPLISNMKINLQDTNGEIKSYNAYMDIRQNSYLLSGVATSKEVKAKLLAEDEIQSLLERGKQRGLNVDKSVVDTLTALGLPSDIEYRKKLFELNFDETYNPSNPQHNIELMNKIKNGQAFAFEDTGTKISLIQSWNIRQIDEPFTEQKALNVEEVKGNLDKSEIESRLQIGRDRGLKVDTSIVDALNALGLPQDKDFRKGLFEKTSGEVYNPTNPDHNIKLLNALKNGEFDIPEESAVKIKEDTLKKEVKKEESPKVTTTRKLPTEALTATKASPRIGAGEYSLSIRSNDPQVTSYLGTIQNSNGNFVLISKKEERAYVYDKDKNLIFTTPVGLGRNKGPDEKMGDGKTLEGELVITSVEDAKVKSSNYNQEHGVNRQIYGTGKFFRLATLDGSGTTATGLHGSDAQGSANIGDDKASRESGGCVRFRDDEIKELEPYIGRGTRVFITSDFPERTTQIASPNTGPSLSNEISTQRALSSLNPSTVSPTTSTRSFKDAGKTLFTEQAGAESIYNVVIPHSSEINGLEAARAEVKGQIVYLGGNTNRNLRIKTDGRTFEIDPNNAFSQSGIQQDFIEKYGSSTWQSLSPSARNAILTASSEVTNQLSANVFSGNKPVLALHQNYNGGFGINSYRDDSKFSRFAEEVYVNPREDPDDFAYVNTKPLFEALKSRGINVVLQNNNQNLDDGSISYAATRRNVPYVNFEVQHNKAQKQGEMIKVLNDLVKANPSLMESKPVTQVALR